MGPVPTAPAPQRYDHRLLALLAVAALLLFQGLRNRGFSLNEGMYAQIGREILLTGDWVTPHLNGYVYLNKPPLLFWLISQAYRVVGETEAVRFLSGVSMLGTAALLAAIARRVWPSLPAAGLWSAGAFLTSALTLVEGRILRPDPALIFFLTLTVWGVVRISSRTAGHDRAAQLAIACGVGLGVMTKGLLGIALPVLVIVPAIVLAGKVREVGRYLPLWSLALMAAIVLPWHIAAGVRNDGFWWDYVVNQHLLVFLDRKFPRDSEPHPLWAVWSMLAARLMPWLLLLPAAYAAQFGIARAGRSVSEWLPITWCTGIWFFFSITSHRLEHHFVPVVPGAALLVGGYCARLAASGSAGAAARGPGPLLVPSVLLALIGLAGVLAAPPAILSEGIARSAPGVATWALAAFGTVLCGGLAATVLALRRGRGSVLAAIAVTGFGFAAIACPGMDAVDPLTSPRALIRRLPPGILATSEPVYEAGEEYQLCGGLAFYLGRPLLLLEPPGFKPPTYLARDISRLFVSRETFWPSWQQGQQRYVLFSDFKKSTNRPADFPPPKFQLDKGAGHLVLTNLPPPAGTR